MATNNFLPWGDNAGNIMDGADYEASTQRTDGVELGLADPALHNRLYRQVTLMAAALGQVIADSGLDATDSNMADLVRAIKQVFFAVVPVDKGGTGATDAAGALANLGGFPKTGGDLNGGINFGQTSSALSWVYEDGRQWHVRPDADIDIFQVVRVTSDGSAYGYFNIDADGNVTFTKPLSVGAGGTGASDAAGARANLGITPQNIGALPSSGGPITGYLQFGTVSNGLEWFTANGTQIHLRPYTPNNVFQITFKGPDTENQEIGAVNIDTSGHVDLGQPLGIKSGGLGRSFASEEELKNYLTTLLGLS